MTELSLTTGETYIVRRSASPMALHNLFGSADDALGGQAEWFWGLPGVFHALASPRSAQPVPAAPVGADAPHSQSLGYWASLQYILLHRLGWSKPHRGLMRWYDLGKPTDDPTLALVAEVWDRDGWLDVYLAWLLLRQPTFLQRSDQPAWNSDPAQLDTKWRTWVEDTVSSKQLKPAPHFDPDQNDNLHLTGHDGEGGDVDSRSSLTALATEHRAVYVTDTMSAWYWDLPEKTRALPPSSRSWRVDVFVRPVGFLGTYRISRSTGLMFTGRHRYHSMGN